MRKIIQFYTIIFLLAAVHTVEAADNTIKIGWIGPLTGGAAALGVDDLPSVQLVVDELNKSGGVQGKQIELIVEDDQYQTQKTVAAYKKLVHQQNVRIIFLITYSGLFAVAPDAARDGVVLLDPLDCDEAIAKLPQNVFCVAKTTEDLGQTLGKAIVKQKDLPVAFLYYASDAFMGTAARSAIDLVKEQGGAIIEESYIEGTTDFKPILLRLRQKGAKSFAFLGYDELGFAMRQAREVGIDDQFYSLNTVMSPGWTRAAGNSTDGSFVATWMAPRSDRLEKYFKDFQAKVGRMPNLEFASVPPYDAAHILFMALANSIRSDSGAVDTLAVQRKLYQVKDYQGLSGSISIDDDGIVRSLKNSLYLLKEGKLEKQ